MNYTNLTIKPIKRCSELELRFLEYMLNKDRTKYFEPHPFTLDYLIGISINSVKDIYVILFIDGVVAGYGMLRGMDSGYTVPSLGIIVFNPFRGLGIGKEFMDYLHSIAELNGYTDVMLKVNKDNWIAKKLYESLGYIFTEGEVYFEGHVKL